MHTSDKISKLKDVSLSIQFGEGAYEAFFIMGFEDFEEALKFINYVLDVDKDEEIEEIFRRFIDALKEDLYLNMGWSEIESSRFRTFYKLRGISIHIKEFKGKDMQQSLDLILEKLADRKF